MNRLSRDADCTVSGVVSVALILGALGFEYIGGYPPCEMCMWQRYPHFGAIVVGLGGGIVANDGHFAAKSCEACGDSDSAARRGHGI